MIPALTPADEHEIAKVLVRYATAIDTRDWPLLEGCFTSDVRADYGDFGAWSDAPSLCAFMAQMHADVGPTLHRLSNIVAAPAGEGASVRSYVDAVLVMSGPDEAHRVAGVYQDQMVRTAQGWRIAERRYTTVWFSPWTVGASG